MKITPEQFRIELNWMRKKGIVPKATGARVDKKASAS
jgi:hypothetical protein